MLVPLALLFAFARRWRPLAVLLGVPLAASAAAALAIPHPGRMLTRTLPFLLRGQDAYARPYDASLTAILPRLGVAPPAAALAALALAAAGVWAARIRWRRGGDERLRLVETASMLMLATFLAARPAFLHYVLVVVPVLLASLPERGSPARSPWFWIPLLPQNAAITWPYLGTGRRRAFKDAAMLTGLALLLAWRSAGRPAWRPAWPPALRPSRRTARPPAGAVGPAPGETPVPGPELPSGPSEAAEPQYPRR
jgi:arabinofuranan 3-O-arabinosyltransferase